MRHQDYPDSNLNFVKFLAKLGLKWVNIYFREARRAESNASGQAAMPGNSRQCRQEKKHCRKKTIQIAVEKHQALQVHCFEDVLRCCALCTEPLFFRRQSSVYGSGGLIETYNVSICMILNVCNKK